jgi:hypothetical protein
MAFTSEKWKFHYQWDLNFYIGMRDKGEREDIEFDPVDKSERSAIKIYINN